ncbi:ferric reductase NAD binding domain-containing protein [Flagelloscypha sp. PMI_526]|nr:ferric reductase NAD binding domain-containing protein [Flagelloscypha sp. PMI_526]
MSAAKPNFPLIKKPILLHSSRVPSGYNFSAMSVEEKALLFSKWHFWYQADWDYGLTTIYFFCAAIGVLAIYQYGTLWRSSRKSTAKSASLVDRVVAGTRYLSSRQYRVQRLGWYSPSVGVLCMVGAMWTFTMALTFAVRPLYWPNMEMGHSPPLATRSGWISIAIMPFMIAFATKVNPVSIVTAISHEKLQVFHRWSATIMYITSLLHTFPFIINSIQMKEMESQWFKTNWYWTGVAALIPQTWLIFMSWGIIRNPYYEFFKKMHFVASILFMVFLFIHCSFRLSSWDYFIATGILYASSWLYRYGRMFLWSSGFAATVESLPDEMVRVTVKVPSRFKWSPGQHVFVRFIGGGVGIHALTSHPFSISNIPESVEGSRDLEIVFRAYSGVTRRLYDVASGKPSVSTRVILDGPYGGVHLSLRSFDKVFLIAGGSGATMIVSLLSDLVQGFRSGMYCKHVEFILAVRTNDSPAWIKQTLASAVAAAEHHKLVIHVHVTRVDKASDDILAAEAIHGKDASSIASSEEAVEGEVKTGRPALVPIIREAARSTTGRLAMAACGPDSLLYDVRNTVAECNLDLMDGFSTLKEIYLHTEHYSW